MRVRIDAMGRIHLVDDYVPSGVIIFERHGDRVAMYQDSEDTEIRTKFENIDESADFDKVQLVEGLEHVIELLKENKNE